MNIEDYKGLVYNKARGYKNLLALDPTLSFDDLIAEGFLIFAKQEKLGEEDPSVFGTNLAVSLDARYKSMYRNMMRRRHNRADATTTNNLLYAQTREKGQPFSVDMPTEVCYQDLSQDAKTVVLAITNSPKELLDMCPRKGLTRHVLRKYLHSKLGWKTKRIKEFLATL